MASLQRVLLLVIAAIFLAGCSTTTIATVWKSPDAAPVHFDKVLVVVANASSAERRAGEDELVRGITSTKAVASYTLVTDDDLKDKAKVLEAIEGQGFDGAAVIRLVSTDKKTTYVPPQYSPTYDPFFGHYGYGMPTAGYTTVDVIVTSEASLYSIKDKKLIWAGSSTTENPTSIGDLVAQVARASAGELRKLGILR